MQIDRLIDTVIDGKTIDIVKFVLLSISVVSPVARVYRYINRRIDW